MSSDWFADVDEYDRRARSAKKLCQQFADRVESVGEELEAVNRKVMGARFVVDHHKKRRRQSDLYKYHLPDGSIISVEEMQQLRERLEELGRTLSGWLQAHTESKEIRKRCIRQLRELVFEAILKADLTEAQKQEVRKEAGRWDIDIQIEWGEKEVHVYFGNPNKDPHGHVIIVRCGRLRYLRFRNMSRDEALHFTVLRGMTGVRAMLAPFVQEFILQ